MEISKQDLARIVERASTINERLKSGFIPDKAQANEGRIKYLLEKWCQVVAQGNKEKFAKRLAWDGLNIKTVQQGLGSVYIAEYQPLPTWVETLKLVIQSAATVSLKLFDINDSEMHRYFNPEEPIAFEEFCLPFIKVAQQKLIVQAGSSYSLFTEAAHANLERDLLRNLSYICSQTLKLEFSIFSSFKQSIYSHLLAPSSSNPNKKQYQAFIKQMLKEGLLAFFQEYSVLARLMVTTTDLWVEANTEFLSRLESDWQDIQQTFLEDTHIKKPCVISQQKVVAIETALSDLHNGGRSVAVLTLAFGQKLIYKPKNLGLEVAYFQFLDWLNKQGTKVLLPLKVLKVLNCSTHGWVEYVQHSPCKDKTAAERYYQRAGMLLCLTYVFGGIDFHQNNLIASGENPILIDLETLMHHQVRDSKDVSDHAFKLEDGEADQTLIDQQLYNSVLRSGLLPRWQFESDEQVPYDASGLGDSEEKESTIRLCKWQDINTDKMALGYELVKTRMKTNAPFLDGVNLLLSDYTEDFIKGFQQLYQFLMSHRDAILAEDGPITAFAQQPVRFLFRRTKVYATLLNQTLDPKFLRDGCERSIELDILSRGLLSSDFKHPFWPLLNLEQQAIEQLDIPLFNTFSDSDSLTIPLEGYYSIAPYQTIERCFKQSSYNHVISRFRYLSEADLNKQISIIRGVLYAHNVYDIHRTLPIESINLNLTAPAPFTSEVMVQQAVTIAQQLKQMAIYSTDGSVTWIGLSCLPDNQRLRLEHLNYGLYDGVSGIALFLAALEKVTGDTARFSDLALAALQPLHNYVQKLESKQKFVKSIGIGGGKGLGSIVYSLVRISHFLKIETASGYGHGITTLLEDAKQVASLMTSDLITVDQNFDIMGGSAGAILGLIALHKAITNNTQSHSSPLQQAIACGHHLLKYRVVSDTGYRTWVSKNGKLLTGFSHGAAGIAYALLRLYETTQEAMFLDAAEEALGYERSVFSPQLGNWPDFRLKEPMFITNWCHGAPGIGLGRLGSLVILDTNEIRQEIEIAIKTTQQLGLQGIDHLCCGNLGRLELLVTAAQKLSRPELLEAARKEAGLIVAYAQQKGTFRLIPGLTSNVYSPGFFQGLAGIGYELLRLAYPDKLPSVLLWE